MTPAHQSFLLTLNLACDQKPLSGWMANGPAQVSGEGVLWRLSRGANRAFTSGEGKCGALQSSLVFHFAYSLHLGAG